MESCNRLERGIRSNYTLVDNGLDDEKYVERLESPAPHERMLAIITTYRIVSVDRLKIAWQLDLANVKDADYLPEYTVFLSVLHPKLPRNGFLTCSKSASSIIIISINTVYSSSVGGVIG